MEKHEELQALTEKQLLTEILLELRLQDINADIYDLVKGSIWEGRY